MQGEYWMVSILQLLVCFIGISMHYIFFNSIFDKKSGRSQIIIAYILTALATFIISGFQISWLNLAVIPLFLLLLALFEYKISLSNAVAYTIIFYVVFTGGKEVVFVLFNRLLVSLIPGLYRFLEGPDGIYILTVEQLLGFFILLYTIRYIKELRISNDNRFSWYLLIIPTASLFILSSFLYMDFPDARQIQILICVGGFLLYFSNIAVFIILTRYTFVLDKIKYAEMYQLKTDLESENFKRIDELNVQTQ